jgi:hypothetical protein
MSATKAKEVRLHAQKVKDENEASSVVLIPLRFAFNGLRKPTVCEN